MRRQHPALQKHDQQRTRGERIADRAAAGIGSWAFLGAQSVFLACWMVANGLMLTPAARWDRYPFILLNLCLSFQAAYTGPVLLLAGKRQEARDRDQAAHDHEMLTELLERARGDRT